MMSATGSRASSDAGIALLEVLVAVAIFFAGVAAMLRVCAVAASAVESARETVQADSLLRVKLAEFDLQRLDGRALPLSAAGEFPETKARYRWSVVTMDAPARGVPGLRELVLVVWRNGSRRRFAATTWLPDAAF